jgi:hypothetical protein
MSTTDPQAVSNDAEPDGGPDLVPTENAPQQYKEQGPLPVFPTLPKKEREEEAHPEGWLDLELQPLAEAEWRPQLRWEREEEVSILEILLKRLSFKGWMIPGLLPAMLICAIAPPVLTWIFMMGRLGVAPTPPEGYEGLPLLPKAWDIPALCQFLVQYGTGGFIFAGVFAVGLMAWMRSYPRETPYREYPHVMTAAYFGTILSFLNISAYYSFAELYTVDILCPLRFCVLSVWSGMVWGGWVGWSSYRENHTERGWLPRLTLMNFFAVTGGILLVAVLFLPSFLKIAPPVKERPRVVRPWEQRRAEARDATFTKRLQTEVSPNRPAS